MLEYSSMINSMILEFKSNLSKFDKAQFKNNCIVALEAPVDKFILPTVSPTLYTGYIDKVISDIDGIAVDTTELDAFYSKVYKSISLEETDIAIPIIPKDEVQKIRPEYLNSISVEFNTAIKNILSGKMKDTDITKKYNKGEYFDKVKKQLVTTDVVVNDAVDLMMRVNPTIEHVKGSFIQTVILPFIREYPQKSKELKTLAFNTKGAINNSYADIMSSVNAIEDMKTSGKIQDPKMSETLEYAKYNILRQYMNLCAYVSAMLIRKIQYYTSNMIQFIELVNTIYRYYPEGERILHENVLDGEITDIDDTTLVNSMLEDEFQVVLPHIQSVIGKKKMEIANYISRKYNIKIDYMTPIDNDKYPYDVYPYVAVNKTLTNIADNIATFKKLINPDAIIDEILNTAGLSDTFSNKYGDILESIPNVQFYTANNSEGAEMSLLNDITHFEKNVRVISNNAAKIYGFMKELQKEYEVNNHTMDDNLFNEISEVIEQIVKNYKEYILHVAKRLFERLDNLIEVMEYDDEEDNSVPEQFVPYDYSFEYYKSMYDDMVADEKKVFTEMAKEYHRLREKKNRGVNIIYEEVKETEAGEGSTTPKVSKPTTTNSNSNTTNPGDNTNNNSTDNKGKENTGVVARFKEWVKKTWDMIVGNTKKMTTINNDWLLRNKEKLNNLDMDGRSITLAKYPDLEISKINKEMTDASTKIKGIPENNLPAELKKDADTAALFIFPNIPKEIKGANDFSSRIKMKYTYGNDGNKKLVTYSDDDAKQKISEMISFCEEYEKSISDLRRTADTLNNDAAEKQEKISASNKESVTPAKTNTTTEAKPTNESVLFEAEDLNKPDTVSTSSVITNTIKAYTGAVLTELEAKYSDYISTFSKLLGNEADGKAVTNPAQADKQSGNEK